MNAVARLALPLAVLVSACNSPDSARQGSDAPRVLALDMIDVKGDQGSYVTRHDGMETRITFPLPVDRINPTHYHMVERIGETSGGVVAVLDTYGSRTEGRCANGREAWLRLFSPGGKRQIEAIPVESCIDDLVPANPPVTLAKDVIAVGNERRRRFVVTGETIVEEKRGE